MSNYYLGPGVPGKLFDVTGVSSAAITGTSVASVSATYTASTSAVTAAPASIPAKVAVTYFSGSSNVATVYTIESPAGTVRWQKYISAAGAFEAVFNPPLYINTKGATVGFKAGQMVATNYATVNGAGYEVEAG